MAINSFRAFLFIAAGSTAAVATAYVSGALDPYLMVGRAAVATPPGQASTKGERLGEQQAAIEPGKTAQPEATGEPGKTAQPEATGEPGKTAQPEAEAEPGRVSQPEGSAEPGEAPKAAPPEPKPAVEAALPAVVAPSFDIVRAEPDGSIVVAGKAAPEAMVEIVAGATVLGKTKAGADGDFAIVLDEPLKPGGHELVLRSTAEHNVVATSPETAVVSIPEQEDGQVLALVEKPGEPSKLITVPKPASVEPRSQGEASGASSETAQAKQQTAQEQPAAVSAAPPAAGQATGAGEPAVAEQPETASAPKIAVDAVEIEGRKVFVAGAAEPGRKVRVYANDILLGEAPASPGGRFLIETDRELPVGDYIIRADALEADGDKVVARAAVPFEREPGEAVAAVAPEASPKPSPATPGEPASPASPTTAESPKPAAPASPSVSAASPEAAGTPPAAGATGQGQVSAPSDETTPAPEGKVAAAVPETAKLESAEGAVIIRRGDTLWKISRRVYGRGVRYSTIYLANQDQINNPDLIWPGQVFSVPQKTEEGEPADMSTVKDQATTMPSGKTQ